MNLIFDWHIEDVDTKTKNSIENELKEKITSTTTVPKKYKNQNLKISIYKNPDDPTKNYSMSGEIFDQTNESISEYKLAFSPLSETSHFLFSNPVFLQ